jgi:hypothetical protein
MTRMTLRSVKYILVLCFIAHGAHSFGLTLYVAERGSDRASGLSAKADGVDGPLASVDAAIRQAARLRSPGDAKRVEIAILDGVYRIHTPIRISGAHVPPLRIFAVNPGKVRISGGRELNASRPLRPGEAATLPISSRPNVRVFDLAEAPFPLHELRRHGWNDPSGVANTDLYYLGRRMQLARWPRQGYAFISALGADAHRTFSTTPAPPELQTIDTNVFAVGYFSYEWAMEAIPIEASGTRSSPLMLTQAPSFPMQIGGRIFLENLLSQLTSPGDWVLDAANRKIFFWPPAAEVRQAEISDAESLIAIDGASHVELDGLTLELARGPAIVINASDDIVVREVSIRHIGGRAIDASGKRIKIVFCHLHDLGDGGVYLTSGDRRTLTPGGSEVTGNDIHDFANWNTTYRPGIYLTGVGNVAQRNRIHDAPHSAIVIDGNDNVVRSNEIHHVVQDSSDAGAIYMGRDWTKRGNSITGNFFHDIGVPSREVAGIYLDDQISGTVIEGNLFLRVSKAILVGGGRDNVIAGNLFVDGTSAVSLDDRGLTWQAKGLKDSDGPFMRGLNAVPYQTGAYLKYPHLRNILRDDPGAPKYNVMRDNAMVNTGCTAQSAPSGSVDWWEIFSGNLCVDGRDANHFGASAAAFDFTRVYDASGPHLFPPP